MSLPLLRQVPPGFPPGAGQRDKEETYDCLEILLLVLVVVMAEVDELPLQLVLELLEGLDGLALGRVRRGKVNGLCGSLANKHSGESEF